MMLIYVGGIGLCGPALEGWVASLPTLSGAIPYEPTPPRVPPASLLPPNERRRAIQTVKLALAVGAEAFAATNLDPGGTATVFASSGGDGETIHEILKVLASAQRDLSPTRFHNSVHNTPAGYWGIAVGAREPSNSICCHDDSFAAGLLEAATQICVTRQPVALIAYDVPYPAPLGDVRRLGAPFAVALVLTPTPESMTTARIKLALGAAAPSTMAPPGLETLRQSTPAARSLPLLVALASGTTAALTLSYLEDMALYVSIEPLREGVCEAAT
jgi:Beta-ketoacyl synthase, N-terminal domain